MLFSALAVYLYEVLKDDDGVSSVDCYKKKDP